jgi:hypothetical protein
MIACTGSAGWAGNHGWSVGRTWRAVGAWQERRPPVNQSYGAGIRRSPTGKGAAPGHTGEDRAGGGTGAVGIAC